MDGRQNASRVSVTVASKIQPRAYAMERVRLTDLFPSVLLSPGGPSLLKNLPLVEHDGWETRRQIEY